jgi:uncharacterized membrane protein
MSDLGDGDVRTTTTRVDPVTGASETHVTTEPRRGGGQTVWIVLGLVAVIAIVALVYLFNQNSSNQMTAQDQATVNQQLGAANANAANASQAASNAANAATTAAGNAASAAGQAASNAAQRTSDTAAAAADSAPVIDAPPPSSQQ